MCEAVGFKLFDHIKVGAFGVRTWNWEPLPLQTCRLVNNRCHKNWDDCKLTKFITS